jgi:hypothetical protein
MSDFACFIHLTGIYPVCHTALFPSNDVSHEQKKLVNNQEKNPAGVQAEQTATPIGEVALGTACTKDTTFFGIGKFENVVCGLLCCIVPLFTVKSDTRKIIQNKLNKISQKQKFKLKI